MAKARPAQAGGTSTPAELLAQAEAALAGLEPEDRAAAEEELDELRRLVQAEREAERHVALAEQEMANHVLAAHDFEAEPGGPPDSFTASMPDAAAPAGMPTTEISGE